MVRPFCLFAALWIACLTPGAQERETDPFLAGDPLSFEQIREAIGVIYEGRLRTAIRNRGVSFTVTNKELELLRQAGASAVIAEELKRAKGPEPPPAPQPDAEGRHRFAAELLNRAAANLGEAELSISGRLLLDRPDSRVWNFSVRLRKGGALEAEAGGASLSFAGGSCDMTPTARTFPAELEQSLRLLCLMQPAALVRRILANPRGLQAEGPLISAAREWVVRVPAPQACELALSRDLLPVEAKHGAGIASYSNYLPVKPAAAPYPREIVLRVEKPQPFRAHFLFDSVAP